MSWYDKEKALKKVKSKLEGKIAFSGFPSNFEAGCSEFHPHRIDKVVEVTESNEFYNGKRVDHNYSITLTDLLTGVKREAVVRSSHIDNSKSKYSDRNAHHWPSGVTFDDGTKSIGIQDPKDCIRAIEKAKSIADPIS